MVITLFEASALLCNEGFRSLLPNFALMEELSGCKSHTIKFSFHLRMRKRINGHPKANRGQRFALCLRRFSTFSPISARKVLSIWSRESVRSQFSQPYRQIVKTHTSNISLAVTGNFCFPRETPSEMARAQKHF